MATKKAPPDKQTPEKVAILKIGFNAYMLPVDDATKVVVLLRGAVALDYSHGLGHTFVVSGREYELSIDVVSKKSVGVSDGN